MHSSSNLLSNYFLSFFEFARGKPKFVPGVMQYESAEALLHQNPKAISGLDAEVKMHTKHEVADYLKVSIATIDRLIRSGQIETLKIGRSVRITDKALRRFLASQEVKR